ncbi:macrophage mannose receptor 1 [Plectropomus leopardus]|uniref:macrophage mannose receptor 1 n=1 Tax=Plectropomus leopardus TaxID=160734 RepID=UPI001C4D5494|nr:macrophage mannose receptor 1 [Plectropomus leopardus]
MPENRFCATKETQTLYLLFISGFCSFTAGSSDFHLISISKNYTEAKHYCREMYTDLATIHNSTDTDNLIALVPSDVIRAWIGLEAGDEWTWHWSWPDQKVDFVNWKAGEPQIKNEDTCVEMDQRGEWIESDCRTRKSFVCHGNSDTSGLIFVDETKSWRDAQNHCRGLSSDLISIHSAEENEAVRNVSLSQNVWIGLFKDPWKWSDGSETSFRYWRANQPNYNEGQACTVAVFRDKGKWNDLKCSTKRKFVCRGARKSIPTTTNQASTQETLTTDQPTVDLTTLPNMSEVMTTLGLHLTVDTTNNSQAINVTTEEATTSNGMTTPNTTDLVSSMSNTEVHNSTTEMSTVTETQQPPTTTATVTTDGVSTLTTLMGTSAQTTAQYSTLTPTENIQSVATGNLILIQENMTWIEAMGYCKEHHVDLVHITNKDIQGKVAEKAKNATSLHVWLGLRYTCKFNFWFWTKQTAGCYQNWALGQGPEGKYECGVTGAIEATGRQQWVGLPETEKLNFICYTCTE